MPRNQQVKRWIEEVSEKMPQLSKSQALGLALWSFAIVMTQSCGLTTVSGFLAKLLGKKPQTMRQQLREWYQDKDSKKGHKRQELDVSLCFAYLLKWILSYWQTQGKELLLSLDATTLGTRFVVLAIAVMYRGSALYIAWVVLPATKKGSWKGPWLNLVAKLKGQLPADWQVMVLSDRGLYAPWLYQAIRANGWHPFMRIRCGGTFCSRGSKDFKALKCLAPQVGCFWSGKVTLFKHNPLICSLLVAWEAGYEGAWFIITDLEPEHADHSWYGLRAWIEVGFKQQKRSGWHWHRTRMDDPERASRLWLALAVASLWVLSVGTQAEDYAPSTDLSSLPESHIARRKHRNTLKLQLLSCFREGLSTILTTLLAGHPLPLGYFRPKAQLSLSKASPPLPLAA